MVEKIKMYKVIHCTVFFLNSIGFKFATMSVCAETYLHFLSLNRSGYGANQKWLCYHCKNETWSCAKELVLILSIPTWRSLTQHLLPSIQTPSLITYTFIECTQSDCIIFVFHEGPSILCFVVEHPHGSSHWCCSKLPQLKNPAGSNRKMTQSRNHQNIVARQRHQY